MFAVNVVTLCLHRVIKNSSFDLQILSSPRGDMSASGDARALTVSIVNAESASSCRRALRHAPSSTVDCTQLTATSAVWNNRRRPLGPAYSAYCSCSVNTSPALTYVQVTMVSDYSSTRDRTEA